jgi:membrane associated rhomboid family serine protease
MFIPLYDHNPSDPMFYPWVTRALVVWTVLVFILFQLPIFFDDPLLTVLAFGIVPAAFSENIQPTPIAIPGELTFITYMFLHGGWMHLIGNMLFLWVFGDNVEHAMGRLRFLLFYLACGAAGGVAHYLSMPDFGAPLIGASAAIAGVVAAYLMLFPHAQVWILLFFRIPIRLSAKWVLGGWIAFQFVNLFVSLDAQVAWWAHIGGIIAGAILVIFLRRPDVPLFARDVRVIADVR